jgi:hypothetical protein
MVFLIFISVEKSSGKKVKMFGGRVIFITDKLSAQR